jgi:hypothetical protein
MMQIAQFLVLILQIWGIIGALVAAVFLTIGLERIDEDAQGTYVFRPLLIPGILMIWPLVLWRWWRIETQRDGWAKRYRPWRVQHGLAAVLMGLAIAVALITGISIRQSWPSDVAPVPLSQGASE